MSHPHYIVLPPDQFGPEEAAEAKRYWSQIPFMGYAEPQRWSGVMATRVLRHKPRRVLEFGCAAAKNLLAIQALDPAVDLYGLDINAAAIDYARGLGLRCGVGNETTLSAIPDNAFDVAFTISVLDHLPSPEIALKELLRLATTAVILYEPWLGTEGRVTHKRNPETGKTTESTPYSYSWDYHRLAAEHTTGWRVAVEDAPLGSKSAFNLGAHYKVFTFTPEQ